MTWPNWIKDHILRWIIGTIALPIIIVAITYIPKSPNPPTQTTNTIPFVELTPFSVLLIKGKSLILMVIIRKRKQSFILN